MIIAIRKEPNGLIYIDKNPNNPNIDYTQSPYNFILIDVEKEDCESYDFNDDLTFNIEKYNARKQLDEKKQKIPELKQQLAKYKEDVEQVELFGMERADYEEKKKACAEIILELRQLEREVEQ